MEIVEFVRAQILIDEEKAKACSYQEWTRDGCSIYSGHPMDEVVDWVYDEGGWDHIANWDPSRVLREVQWKRKILDLYATEVRVESEHDGWTPGVNKLWGGGRRSALGEVVELLAADYADLGRPGYQESWRPT